MSTVAPEGLIVQPSSHGHAETLERVEAGIKAEGMAVVARIDHAAAAASDTLSLRPTTVLLFGNPRVGTPLMQATPTIAIHLPLKILVWQDDNDRTWIAYDDPHWFGARHNVEGQSVPALEAMNSKLRTIAQTSA